MKQKQCISDKEFKALVIRMLTEFLEFRTDEQMNTENQIG